MHNDCWLVWQILHVSSMILVSNNLDNIYQSHVKLFTNVGWDHLCESKRSNDFVVLCFVLRQQSRDRLKALCGWISTSRLWDWTWQLAQWRWFMTGQESQRWMRRNNFDQSFPLTTEESLFLVLVDLAVAWLYFPEGSGTICRLVLCLLSSTLHRVQMVLHADK